MEFKKIIETIEEANIGSDVNKVALAHEIQHVYEETKDVSKTYKIVAKKFNLSPGEVSDFDKENRITDSLNEWQDNGSDLGMSPEQAEFVTEGNEDDEYVEEKLLNSIAAKLSAEGITKNNYTKNNAIKALKNTVTVNGLTKILIHNEKEIISKLTESLFTEENFEDINYITFGERE